MLKRTDWRSLQWTEDDASGSVQLEFAWPLREDAHGRKMLKL
jgi:hypothetical protein